jgi:hypothetical protein
MSLKHLLGVTALSVCMLALGALFGEDVSPPIADAPPTGEAHVAAQPAKKPALLAHSFASRWVFPNGPKY